MVLFLLFVIFDYIIFINDYFVNTFLLSLITFLLIFLFFSVILIANREFGVDYMWLTTGEGEMFVETDDDFFERIDRIMAGENETRKNMIKMLLYASDDDIKAFDRLVDYYISLREEK